MKLNFSNGFSEESRTLQLTREMRRSAGCRHDKIPGLWLAILLVTACFSVQAQPYAINWYKVAGGGGSSTGTNAGTNYSVSGTIGQHDASSALTGGSYSLTGGFWSLISLVQTPGAPTLTISYLVGSVIVSWPATGSFTLQQTSNLAAGNGWATSGYTIGTSNGTNSITITPPTGSLFFRLKYP